MQKNEQSLISNYRIYIGPKINQVGYLLESCDRFGNSNTVPSSKKAWLDYLYYFIGRQRFDYWLCGTFVNKEGALCFTKWKKYSEVIFSIDYNEDYKIKWINQRQILPIEVVIDLETKEQLPGVLKELDEFQFRYYVFSTHSRGYHIHLFFNRELSKDEKLAIITHFGADKQKATIKTQIALEFTPHWKSGKIKELILWK